jgi:hypothetical protein
MFARSTSVNFGANKIMNRFSRYFVVASAMALSCLYAQDFRATLSGQVKDPSGAGVPDATVTAIQIGTNQTKEVKTSSDGRYTIPYLDPGTYNVEVAAAGFEKLKREGIVLQVADKLNLPMQLSMGQMSQEVTVVGQQEILETGTADRGLVFDPIKTQEYPLNGRQTYMLMSLTPGVVFTQEQFGASGFSGTRGWDVNNSYKINGARTGENLFLLNGAPISDNGGSWQLAPNVEAVQEFKVMTNTYDASYGRFGGGVVNTTLKAGTNSWHGDVFEYYRNRILDANTFQNNSIGAPKGFHNQHQFGGVVGGPVRKDKDFIFGSFEGWQEVVPFPAVSSAPPLALRDGQHFSDFGIKVYDPLTIHVCAAPEPCQGQTYIANQFPGNVIPPSRISPVGAKILSYYPAPNGPNPLALNANFIAAGNVGRYYYEQPMVRWDHIFGQNDKLYGVYTGQQGYEYRSSTGFPKPAATGNTNNQRTDQNAIIDYTHVMTATTVFDVRGSFGRFVQTTPGYSDLSLTAAGTFGMTQLKHAPNSPGDVPPSINVGDFSGSLFGSGTAYSWSSYNQWNFTPSLTMTRGKHTVRTGFEMNYVMNGSNSTGSSNGSFTFNSSWTQQLRDRRQSPIDGSSVATLLLGYPTSGSIDNRDSIYRTRPYYGLYVQDDWKVTSRLTVNLGLRYDVQIPWLERYNRENRGFDASTKNPLSDQIIAAWKVNQAAYNAANPNAKYPYPNPPAVIYGGLLFPGVGGQPRRLYDTDWTNIAPRAGFAYRLLEKTVLRGGAGIYYQSSTQGGTTAGFQQNTPYITSLDGAIPSAGASLSGPFSLVNPFPNGFLSPVGSSLGLLTNVGNGISFDPPTFRIPRSYQYSFGIQQQLPGGIVADISYAGNLQNHINLGQDIDHVSLADQLQAAADPAYFSRQLPNPFYGIVPISTGLGANKTVSADNLLRPDPIFQGNTNNLIQQGKYRSDQLQVKIEKRAFGNPDGSGAAGVLTWVVSYAFGKAFEMNHRLNGWNAAEPLIREIDNTDKAQNVSFSGVWDLPIGNGRKLLSFDNKVARQILDNWRFDWILTYESGYPTVWPNTGNLINTCGEWHAPSQNENEWFNNDKSCYKQSANGNVLRTNPDRFSDIRDPSVGPLLNAALEKTFRIGERYRIQFRGESFNLTNHPVRPGPDNNFNSQTFGQLPKSQNNFPRLVQLAAKFYF